MLSRAMRGLPVAGAALTTCSACSSGLGSIALGLTLLETDQADLVITGGYDPVSEYAYAGFDSLRLVAETSLRPFCTGRDGMKLAEGYGILVLERAADAARRGAPAQARVLGFGESADAHHLTQPHPQGEGAVRAVRAALASAGVEPEEVGLIAAHATGTPGNDVSEHAAYATVFGGGLGQIPVVGFKSHIGHCLGGAGAAELILSAMAMRNQAAPPTANITAADIEFPAITLIAGNARPARIRRTLNTSLGFGGANTCVVLGTPDTDRGAPHNGAPATPAPRDVLITGVGVVLPGIIGIDALGARLTERGAPAVRADTGVVPEEQILPLLNVRRVRRVSDFSKLSLAAAALAYRDAGIDDPAPFGAECSAVLGTMLGSTGYSEVYYRQIITEGMGAANPMLFAEGVPNAASAQLSMMLGIKGSCQTIIGSRTSGLDALGLATLRIQCGLWDRAVVGAGEEYGALVNSAMRACGLYAGSSADLPFAGERGFATGAGAVVLILESASAAKARGARARGKVNGYHASLAAPDSGIERASGVERVVRNCGPVAAVVSSASGSRLDAVERVGLAKAADRSAGLRVSSIHGHVAETLSVSPLAALAGLLITGKLPRLLSPEADLPDRLFGATGDEPAIDVAVLSTDPSGSCSAVRIGVGWKP
jgi:3-oxoacyl-[acyl-carrier-protein] synthase II